MSALKTDNRKLITILVTGGAGFIGSHVADAFIDAGRRVVIIDDLSKGHRGFINPKAKFYKADIRDRRTVSRIISREKPTVVCHHAAQKSVTFSVEDPIHDAEVNVLGLLNLMEEGRQHGLKRVIFASTGGAIYGDDAPIPTPEDYDPQPTSPYGISKLTSEHYLRYYSQLYGIDAVVLRYANVYGPRQDPYGEAGVIAIFAKKLLNNEMPTIFGDGKNRRDYVFVSDVVDANLKALDAKSGAYNIGTSRETDVNGIFAALLAGLKKLKIDTKIAKPVYAAPRPGEQRRSCIKIDHAQKVLGWKPQVTLERGVVETLEFFRE